MVTKGLSRRYRVATGLRCEPATTLWNETCTAFLMRVAGALLVLLLVSPLRAQDGPSPEEVERLSADVLEHTDTDDDSRIALVEQQNRLLNFYVAFAKAGQNEEKQREAREDYPGLLSLQQFLAADLDDDHFVGETELQRLFALEDPEYVWTLSDADVEMLVEDFILRIRKGAKVYWYDELRKSSGKGKTKAEKLADRAEPYKQRVITLVLKTRRQAVIESAYTEDELSSLFDREGRNWQWSVTDERDAGTRSFHLGGLVVPEHIGPYEETKSLGRTECVPKGHKLTLDPFLKGYQVKPDISKVTVHVEAGQFECDHFEISCLGKIARVWLLSKHPALVVKFEYDVGEGKRVTELSVYEE